MSGKVTSVFINGDMLNRLQMMNQGIIDVLMQNKIASLVLFFIAIYMLSHLIQSYRAKETEDMRTEHFRGPKQHREYQEVRGMKTPQFKNFLDVEHPEHLPHYQQPPQQEPEPSQEQEPEEEYYDDEFEQGPYGQRILEVGPGPANPAPYTIGGKQFLSLA